MIMGKPILASDLGFSHSICNESALYFDPLNPKDITNKIEFLIKNKSIQNELISNGYKQLSEFKTAKERAILYIEILEKVMGNKQ